MVLLAFHSSSHNFQSLTVNPRFVGTHINYVSKKKRLNFECRFPAHPKAAV
ncbi:hypothetical protein LEP1GSC198_1196 [Leptospira kirschneri str. JB]|nr:hypothetical protein LEP1GSC198_1196 [Leptospira kirschneri str. JB]